MGDETGRPPSGDVKGLMSNAAASSSSGLCCMERFSCKSGAPTWRNCARRTGFAAVPLETQLDRSSGVSTSSQLLSQCTSLCAGDVRADGNTAKQNWSEHVCDKSNRNRHVFRAMNNRASSRDVNSTRVLLEPTQQQVRVAASHRSRVTAISAHIRSPMRSVGVRSALVRWGRVATEFLRTAQQCSCSSQVRVVCCLRLSIARVQLEFRTQMRAELKRTE
jgi:hypothetical protein